MMQYLSIPVEGEKIAIFPMTWHQHISMRLEVYGCAKGNSDMYANYCKVNL